MSSSSDLPPEFTAQLLEHRAAIDAIDNEMIDLIKRRCNVVAQVGKLKEQHLSARCFIRPAREALMLLRIAEQFEGHPFSAAAAASIWRLMIAASTSLEQPLRIISYFTPTQQDCYWLAREYFGAFSNITKDTVPSRVLGHVMDGNALVGVLPALDNPDSQDAWWRMLLPAAASGNQPHIFACMPYAFAPSPLYSAETMPRPVALGVGYVDCEPTGNDVSYLVVEGKHELSQSKISSHFAAAGIAARWLQVVHEPSHDSRLHLIELDGFWMEDSAPIQSLAAHCGDALLAARILGAHAKPVLLIS